ENRQVFDSERIGCAITGGSQVMTSLEPAGINGVKTHAVLSVAAVGHFSGKVYLGCYGDDDWHAWPSSDLQAITVDKVVSTTAAPWRGYNAAVTPIVRVHGGSFAGSCWDLVVDRLPGPAIAVDLPGRGRHPCVPDEVTITNAAASVVADIDAAGFDDVVLVGHS